ncbi:MAG TPA: Asp-tRNA(Asn)/Glu-tRNA(Gln) amidotransferase subunit GatC [Candidatus Binatia bacterium]|nr:Asp-tRNA(Asn)/Glu-tRNA(Gln) amidotransferase subunit GatC [Candidatus Binatia bacterium]
MKLTREEVQRVAVLARLQLSPEDEEGLTEQLDQILEYMEKLNQLDTSGTEPFSHGGNVATPLREDIVTNQPNPEGLLANAPARVNDFFQVPKIIE